MGHTRVSGRGRLDADGVRRIGQLIVFGLLFSATLFILAGRLDWLAGWAFCGAFLLYLAVLIVWGVRQNPELLNERGRAVSASDTPAWEKALVWFVGGLQLAMIGVAALDAGRYGWSAMALPVQVVGWLGLIPAAILPAWVLMNNAFASVTAHVQEERGHTVVTTGPYRTVRHPMYVGVILFGICTPLALGSWWALIPGGLLALVFVGRTAQEDRKLQRELPGYAEYAQQVRYRLLPGVW